jgi:type VI secretion system Hcp family effector
LATNLFVQFDTIKGECEDYGHPDWCEIFSLKQGFSNEAAPLPPEQPDDESNSRRGKHKAIAISKLIDKASVGLMKACWEGTTLAKVMIECFRSGLDANPQIKYFSVELENVIIKKIKYAVDEGKLVSEDLELVAAKAAYKYWQMDKKDGTAPAPLAGEANITLGPGDHDGSKYKSKTEENDTDGDDSENKDRRSGTMSHH